MIDWKRFANNLSFTLLGILIAYVVSLVVR